jgi:hypothetical protein
VQWCVNNTNYPRCRNTFSLFCQSVRPRSTDDDGGSRLKATDAGGAEGSLDDETVRRYLSALERLMVIEDQ